MLLASGTVISLTFVKSFCGKNNTVERERLRFPGERLDRRRSVGRRLEPYAGAHDVYLVAAVTKFEGSSIVFNGKGFVIAA